VRVKINNLIMPQIFYTDNVSYYGLSTIFWWL